MKWPKKKEVQYFGYFHTTVNSSSPIELLWVWVMYHERISNKNFKTKEAKVQ
jgi:hypothetical protein